MLYEEESPKELTGRLLDDYLARGWYRRQQRLFTSDFEFMNDDLVNVYWIRLILTALNFSASAKRLFNKNRSYTFEHKKVKITPEIDELFEKYKKTINFETTETVFNWLYGKSSSDIFNTQLIEVRDSHKLVAAGYFDIGENSIADILTFYHPDYKKKSLGKYMMLLKIEYAIKECKMFYYPGYICNDYSKFDYKIFPCPDACEVYDIRNDNWISYSDATAIGLGNLYNFTEKA